MRPDLESLSLSRCIFRCAVGSLSAIGLGRAETVIALCIEALLDGSGFGFFDADDWLPSDAMEWLRQRL
jgi:hypothetical protein